MFGSSADRVPYIECSPGGQRAPVAQVCKDARIDTYPTWVINGQRYSGTQTLEALAQFSNYKHGRRQAMRNVVMLLKATMAVISALFAF